MTLQNLEKAIERKGNNFIFWVDCYTNIGSQHTIILRFQRSKGQCYLSTGVYKPEMWKSFGYIDDRYIFRSFPKKQESTLKLWNINPQSSDGHTPGHSVNTIHQIN